MKTGELKETKAGWLNRCLWYCAGVNHRLLQLCPTDFAKYAGMGGTILATAILASLSGGYALYTVFKSEFAAVGFGLFWGFVIFNLDRFIVSTMYSDGKATISKQELIGALPRLIIAVFLGVIISNPLELRIFEREITYEIEQIKNEKASDTRLTTLKNELEALKLDREGYDNSKTELRRSSTADYNTSIGDKINEINREIERMRTSISTYENQLSAVNRTIQNTISSGEETPQNLLAQRQGIIQQRNSANNQLSGFIAEKQRLEGEVRGNMNSELKTLDDRIANIDQLIKLKEQEIETYQTEIHAIADNYDGYMARMEAFSNLRDHNMSVNIAAWFITMLFIIIEIAPTLFKLMIPAGPYDDMLIAEKHRIKTLSGKMISDINNEVDTAIKISTANNQKKIEAEILSNEKLLREIANVQVEIMSTAIAKWREQELAKAENNPEEYIHTTT